MITDVYAERKHLTFAQAEGAAPLPSQLQPKEISSQLRALLWKAVYEHFLLDSEYYHNGNILDLSMSWRLILRDKHVYHDQKMVDEFPNDVTTLIPEIKLIFAQKNYLEIFGFLQFVLRHEYCPSCFSEDINSALEHSNAAYRVLNNNTIIPISSEAERTTLKKAFADLAVIEFHGAQSHLREAGALLTNGKYADSIRESIHTVESVARTLTQRNTLKDALIALEKSYVIHPCLKQGFEKIYNYTSDEKGLRHPLLDNPQANVDETDALFMIGACASFVSYMINKAHSAGILIATPTDRS